VPGAVVQRKACSCCLEVKVNIITKGYMLRLLILSYRKQISLLSHPTQKFFATREIAKEKKQYGIQSPAVKSDPKT
jgi:hypothetical protein